MADWSWFDPYDTSQTWREKNNFYVPKDNMKIIKSYHNTGIPGAKAQ